MDEVNIEFREVELLIVGNYYEEESEIMYDSDLGGYPGSPSSFEILEIKVADSEVDLFDLLEDHLEELERMCIEQIER